METVPLKNRVQKTEALCRNLAELSTECMVSVDVRGRIVWCNTATTETLGFPQEEEELIGRNIFKLKILPPRQVSKAVALLTKSALGKLTGPEEFKVKRKDGSRIAVEILTYPVEIKDQGMVLVNVRNISRCK